MVFWSKRCHPKDILKLTDLYHEGNIVYGRPLKPMQLNQLMGIPHLKRVLLTNCLLAWSVLILYLNESCRHILIKKNWQYSIYSFLPMFALYHALLSKKSQKVHNYICTVYICKGLLISKFHFFVSSISPKNRTKTSRPEVSYIVVKSNFIVRFLEEIEDIKENFRN